MPLDERTQPRRDNNHDPHRAGVVSGLRFTALVEQFYDEINSTDLTPDEATVCRDCMVRTFAAEIFIRFVASRSPSVDMELKMFESAVRAQLDQKRKEEGDDADSNNRRTR